MTFQSIKTWLFSLNYSLIPIVVLKWWNNAKAPLQCHETSILKIEVYPIEISWKCLIGKITIDIHWPLLLSLVYLFLTGDYTCPFGPSSPFLQLLFKYYNLPTIAALGNYRQPSFFLGLLNWYREMLQDFISMEECLVFSLLIGIIIKRWNANHILCNMKPS